LVIQAYDPCLRSIAGAGPDRQSLPIVVRNPQGDVLQYVA
jgi:hypothetical protein